YINEGEYLAPAIFHEEGKVASQMIYSNVREIVEHQQYVFDTLWNKSTSSQERRLMMESSHMLQKSFGIPIKFKSELRSLEHRQEMKYFFYIRQRMHCIDKVILELYRHWKKLPLSLD
ncbi:MAG: hypothetical protein WBF33_38925, partial [Candidatus Nitrosopolaris sp.]